MVSLKSLKCIRRNFSSFAKRGFWTSSWASFSCGSLANSPHLHLERVSGLWIHRRNKSKRTIMRRGKKKPLLLFKATMCVRKCCVKATRRGRACAKWRQMQGKGEEKGNLCFPYQTGMLLLTIFHIFFPCVSSFGYHPSCQQQCHARYTQQKKNSYTRKWLYQFIPGKKFCVIQT